VSQTNHLEIASGLATELQRWSDQLGHDERLSPFGVTAVEVLRAHFLLADYFGALKEGIGGVGPKSLHLLQSAVSRQYVGFSGQQKWTDLFGIAATLFFGLVKNHPFHDANKRTALLTSLFQLQCHNRVVSAPQRDFEVLAVRVAENTLDKYPAFREVRNRPDPEVQFISRFFRKGTRALDKREFRVTYRQLSTILARHGFHLNNNHDNRVDVVKYVEERYGFLGLKTRSTPRRVATIGFKDWGTEVSARDIRIVRDATDLTQENGYDTAVLLQDLNPMETLIAEYAAPLRRLAKK
jgi:death-on-curing family protein